MEISDCFLLIMLIFVLQNSKFSFTKAASQSQTDSEENNTVCLPKDALLKLIRQDDMESNNKEIAQRITALETKQNIYNADRNQFLNYFKVTTDVLERLRKLEKENELLKQSMHQMTNEKQEMINNIQEMVNNEREMSSSIDTITNDIIGLKNKIQNLTNSYHATKENVQEMQNVSRRQDIEINNLNTQIENIEDCRKRKNDNLTEIIEYIKLELKRGNNLNLQHDKNITLNFEDVLLRYADMQDSYGIVERHLDIVNRTCTSAIVAVNTKLETTKREIADLVLNMTHAEEVTNLSIESLRDNITSQNNIQENGIGFSVGLTHNFWTAVPIVKYDINFNSKNASYNYYNFQTGIFVAPTEGNYIFHYHGLSVRGKSIWIELYHNNMRINSAYDRSGPQTYGSAGNSAIIYVNRGDKVYVKLVGSLFGNPSEIYSTFSGYLLP